MKYLRHLIVVPLILAAAPAGLSADDLETLRAVDLRLATMAHRLTVANAPLCRDTVPATGIVLHALSQYDGATQAAAKAVFGFATPVAVEAVVAGSAAEQAGVMRDDGVRAIDGKAIGGSAGTSSADRDAALDALARAAPAVKISLVRSGQAKDVAIVAPRGCRAVFEVLLGPQMTAQSDGRVVQIGVRFFERYRDDETAVIVAHELAHVILRHRMRLDAAGVKGGLLSEVGRNGRVNRLVEDQADRLSVTLLYNAGYDPASAARFWSGHGGDIDGGLFRSRTHPATKDRVAAMQGEAAAIPAGVRPYTPPILATRDQALR